MPQQIILRKGTAAAWTAAGSVVLAPGEPGFETDTGKFKIGNAAGAAWNALPYAVGAIPVNLADLADVTSDTPSSGQVLKWNGSAWAPAADDGGVGGAGTVTSVSGTGTVNGLTLSGTVTSSGNLQLTGALDATLNDLTGVIITTPLANEVLKWDNTTANWINGTTTDNDTTYTLTAQGALGGARINLTGTDSTVDDVTFAQGSGITISGDDTTNTITIASSNTFTGTVNIPVLSLGTGITAANSVNFDTSSGGVAFRPASGLTIFGSESLNRNGGIYQLLNSYQTTGYTFAQHHATADAANFTFYRTRGVSSAPEAVQVGDDLADITFGGHTGTGLAAGAAISAIVDSAINATNIPTKLQFQTNNGSATAARMELSSAGTLKVNNIQALASNGNLNLLANGTGVVTLPAGSTIGGVAIGSLVIKGTVADNTALLALTGMTLGDTYVVLSPTPTHLWSYNGAAFVDLGEFQGPTGQGVPIAGTIGQVLTKNSSTNYDTTWTSLATVATSGAYADLSGTPTLATVATSGAYADLSGTPTAYASTSIDALSDVDTTTSAPTNGQTLVWNSAGSKWLPGTASAGDMVGPASATDNALVRFDGTTGKLSQTSLVTVSDTGAITAPGVGSVIPFYYADQTAFPSATTYHGAIAHSHADGKMYFAHSATWNALANASELPAAYSATSINALSDVDTATAAPSNGQALVWNSVRSNWEPGTVSGGGVTYGVSAETNASGADIRLTGSDASTDNLTIAAGTNVTVTRTDANTITIASSGGGGSMAARGDVAGTTASLADAATGNVAITGFKSYALLKMVVDQPAWVRIYTDTASRSADASRAEGVDPTPGSGVIAEVITTSAAQTVLISPGTIGFNNEGTPTTSIPIAVTNKSGTTRTITVTLTVLQLEA